MIRFFNLVSRHAACYEVTGERSSITSTRQAVARATLSPNWQTTDAAAAKGGSHFRYLQARRSPSPSPTVIKSAVSDQRKPLSARQSRDTTRSPQHTIECPTPKNIPHKISSKIPIYKRKNFNKSPFYFIINFFFF